MSERKPGRKITPGARPALRQYAIARPGPRASMDTGVSIISSQQTGVALGETPRDRVAASERELQPRAGAQAAAVAPFDLHILQILPALESGGVERGTLDVAAAIVK